MRHLPKFKKCEVTGKTAYPKQHQASYAMMRVISHTTTDMFDLHTYFCDSCKKYHFGHKSYFEKSLQKSNTVSSSVVSG